MNSLGQVSSTGDIMKNAQGAGVINPYDTGLNVNKGLDSMGYQS